MVTSFCFGHFVRCTLEWKQGMVQEINKPQVEFVCGIRGVMKERDVEVGGDWIASGRCSCTDSKWEHWRGNAS